MFSLAPLVLVLQVLGIFLQAVQAESFPNSTCFTEGPRFPRPVNLSSSEYIQNATRNLTNIITRAVNGSIKAGWATSNASFSIAFVNMESKTPIWEYHYRGNASKRGSPRVDGNTQYMIGSLSKLLSQLMLMKSGIDMHKPVTTYLPQLNSTTSKIKWNEITVAALGEHLSGIPANYGFSDKYDLQQKLEELGFPHVPLEDYSPCGVEALNPRCTKEQILDAMVKIAPFAPVNRRVVYSQLAFSISSFALSAFSGGIPYRQLVQDLLAKPLGLQNTGASPGDSSKAAIPVHDSWWGQDLHEETPGSGLYSSTNDLCTIMHSILSRSILPESTILRWLKPSAGVSSDGVFSGAPWEIVRASNFTPKYPQIIEFYNKGGSSYGYNGQLTVVDQYGVGIIALVAGDPFAAALLPTLVYGHLIPALEEETRLQARKQYVRTYSGPGNDGRGNSSMTVKLNLTMDNGPGLIIQNLTRGKYNILAALPQVYQGGFANLTKLPVTLSNTTRIFPTDLRYPAIDATGRNVIMEDWRLNWDQEWDFSKWNGTGLPGFDEDTGGKPDACGTWVNADWSNYAGQAIDKITFVKDAITGDVLGTELAWLRANLTAQPHTH